MRLFFYTLAFCCLSLVSLQAQSPESLSLPASQAPQLQYPNHLTISPFYMLAGTFMLSYERLFPAGILRVTPSAIMRNNRNYGGSPDKYEDQGGAIDIGYKIFFTPRIYKVTPYIGPYALYRYFHRTIKEYEYIPEGKKTIIHDHHQYYNILNAGVDSGVKFIFGRFTMDFSIGVGTRIDYCRGDLNIPYHEELSMSKSIVPRFNFFMGLTF